MADSDLDYAKVTGRFALTVADGVDTGDDPDIVWCDGGTVIIEPLITYTKVAGATPPFTAGHSVIEATIDSSGYLTWRGKPYVYVVDLTSSKVNPQIPSAKATHQIRFRNVTADGTSVEFPAANVRLTKDGPDGDGENDLTIALPVASAPAQPIYRGEPGIGVSELQVDGGDLVVTLSDGTVQNAGELPVGPGGSDAGVAGYVADPDSDTAAALSASIAGRDDECTVDFGLLEDGPLHLVYKPTRGRALAVPSNPADNSHYNVVDGRLVVTIDGGTSVRYITLGPVAGPKVRYQKLVMDLRDSTAGGATMGLPVGSTGADGGAAFHGGVGVAFGDPTQIGVGGAAYPAGDHLEPAAINVPRPPGPVTVEVFVDPEDDGRFWVYENGARRLDFRDIGRIAYLGRYGWFEPTVEPGKEVHFLKHTISSTWPYPPPDMGAGGAEFIVRANLDLGGAGQDPGWKAVTTQPVIVPSSGRFDVTSQMYLTSGGSRIFLTHRLGDEVPSAFNYNQQMSSGVFDQRTSLRETLEADPGAYTTVTLWARSYNDSGGAAVASLVAEKGLSMRYDTHARISLDSYQQS